MSANQKSPVVVWASQTVSVDNPVSFADVMSEELAKDLQSKYLFIHFIVLFYMFLCFNVLFLFGFQGM